MSDTKGAKDYKKLLLDKINNKTAVVGVIGLGYVGLPLAVEKAKAGYQVLGFDVQERKVNLVNAGHSYISDVRKEDLEKVVLEGKLKASNDFALLEEADCVAICVPTPLDKYQQPDISYIIEVTGLIAKHLHSGMLVILESTTYPGTTQEVVKPILEEKGFLCGEDLFLAFSPERVDPGNKLYKTKNTPKVVGGVTRACTEAAAALYRNVLEGEVIEVSSPAVAEMEKIFENTFRNINIALSNEMAILCNKMGINVWEVIEAAKSKPYGFMAFYPGPGLGGHCIPIDPFYLTWKARGYNYHTKLIETAGEINTYMPEYLAERVMRAINRHGKAILHAKILILGVAYKQDIDDYRESPALRVLELLKKQGAEVTYNDPYIPAFISMGTEYNSVKLTASALKEADLVLITTAHSSYDYSFIQENSGLIFDARNAMKDVKERENIELL